MKHVLVLPCRRWQGSLNADHVCLFVQETAKTHVISDVPVPVVQVTHGRHPRRRSTSLAHASMSPVRATVFVHSTSSSVSSLGSASRTQ
ncbi:hypothetical protein PMI06_009195 [Burkholderia sp. BT03]|nr:hypothetical protein PMI06_009195 [Burkholderia sp. BT03]SKC95313.1 hypothetical protein SAMN06266956_6890 [Paraburkholderia hospita]